MSEMPPEAGPSGGNFLTRKYAGIPAWVILGGVAVLAYLYFSHKSSATSGGGATSTGGGGQATSGNTVVKKGAVTINVRQSPGQDNDQPSPNPPPKQSTGPVYGGNTPSENFTAPGGEDLARIAAGLGIPEQQLVAFNPDWAKYVGTAKAIPKGTILKIPAAGQ